MVVDNADVWMHVRSWSGMVWLEPETDRKGFSKSRRGFIAWHGWLMESRCDSFGTLRPQGRAGHKDCVAELERAPPAAPEFWQRQGLRTGPRCKSRFSVFWVPNVQGDHFEPKVTTLDTLRPHVVISTKFQEPWYTYSQDYKLILMQLGCSVYNPNTDNVEICKAISKALSPEARDMS